MSRVNPALVTAAVGGVVSVILWLLNRTPALRAEARLADQVERDQRIAEKLRDGVAKDRLVASTESRVVRMLIVRGEGTAIERRSSSMQRLRRRTRFLLGSSMLAAACSAVGGVATVVLAVQEGDGIASIAFGVVSAVMGVLLLRMFWNPFREFRDVADDTE